MPYRVDMDGAPPEAVDVLINLGALDVEQLNQSIAAILPDSVTRDQVAAALNSSNLIISDAVGRDDESVWLLSPRAVQAGGVPIPIALTDSKAFGTGQHPTTALCLEALQEILSLDRIDSVLDVGTGSGILALAALMLGVSDAVGLDIDAEALNAASKNSRLNNLEDRLKLILGGPDAVDGTWPLVVANVLAAPLIEMAPVLVRRVGSGGQLVLSGIQSSLENEVRQAYRYCGMKHVGSRTRDGWTVLMARASW